MYYDTIYARCANGYDLEKRSELHNSGGYKVHGFSREMLSDSKVDIPYLVSILQKTIPADKDSLLDDGFFYSAADTGSRFLTRFHYVTDAFRNFFITQAYVGPYEDFYPFELFTRDDLWDARNKNEEYYLSAQTAYLPALASLERQGAATILQEAIRFIEDGRKPVFKQALAFLISQYGLPKPQRKYLVIRDKTEKEIEYWIAALSSAVSPRMAAELTFATRMESIQNTNRYAADKTGHYQKGMDFQSAPDSLRRIAMIVGAVDADKENSGIASRPNSPYVLLDGAAKTLSETVDASNRYYDFAASFSDSSFYFCRNFVQAFGYTSPTKDILDLYGLFSTLTGTATEAAFASALKAVLAKPIVRNEKLRWLYEKTKKMVKEGDHKDIESLINLSEGLRQISALFGVSDEKEIEEEILGAFEKVLFRGSNAEREHWWSLLGRSQFSKAAAMRFTRSDVFGRNEADLQTMPAADIAKLTEIYLQMQSVIGTRDDQLTETLCGDVLQKCRLANDTKTAEELIGSVDRVYSNGASDIWNDIIKKNDADSTFLLGVMYPKGGAFPADVSKMLNTCSRLHKNGETKIAERIVFNAIESANAVSQVKELMNKLKKEPFFAAIDKAEYFRMIDARVGFNMKDRDIPHTIQKEKPAKTICVHSAHIAALEKLQSMRKNDSAEELLKPYFEQGFPSKNVAGYVNELCNTILRSRLSDEDEACLMKHFVESKEEVYYRTMIAMLSERAAKNADLWDAAIYAAAAEKKQECRDMAFKTIVSVLEQQKASKAAMEKAGKYIKTDSAYEFYMDVIDNVLKKRSAAKPKSGGLFGGLFGKKSDK